MIDNKKIEDVAKVYMIGEFYNRDEAEWNYPITNEEKRNQCIIDFKAGAKWMQEEFLKDLWHPASEEPKENFDLVYINNTKEFREISSYNSDRFDDLFGKGWEAACRMFGIYKWAYKDDLLPKEGGEQ